MEKEGSERDSQKEEEAPPLFTVPMRMSGRKEERKRDQQPLLTYLEC